MLGGTLLVKHQTSAAVTTHAVTGEAKRAHHKGDPLDY